MRISDDWADLPPSLTCLLRLEHEHAGLHARVDCEKRYRGEAGTIVLVQFVKHSWNRIEEREIASWPVEEFSVAALWQAADRWMSEQRREVA